MELWARGIFATNCIDTICFELYWRVKKVSKNSSYYWYNCRVSERQPLPAIFMRNNSEIEYCYLHLDNCIKASMLSEEKWHHVLMFTREDDSFEVYVNNECLGRLNFLASDFPAKTDVTALASSPWFRFRKGQLARVKHTGMDHYFL